MLVKKLKFRIQSRAFYAVILSLVCCNSSNAGLFLARTMPIAVNKIKTVVRQTGAGIRTIPNYFPRVFEFVQPNPNNIIPDHQNISDIQDNNDNRQAPSFNILHTIANATANVTTGVAREAGLVAGSMLASFDNTRIPNYATIDVLGHNQPEATVDVIPGTAAATNAISTRVNRSIGAANRIFERVEDLEHHLTSSIINVTQSIDTTSQNMAGRVEALTGRFEAMEDDMGERVAALTGRFEGMEQHVANTVNGVVNNMQQMNDNLNVNMNNLVDTIDQRANNLLNNMDARLDRSIKKGALLATGAIIASITAWYGSKFLWNAFDRYYNTPKLFTQESSNKTVLQKLKEFIVKPKIDLPVIITDSAKEYDLNRIIESTKTINSRILAGDPYMCYRNLLLWGPSGTGKTLFAMKLARASGMEFKAMSGGDLFQLKEEEALKRLGEVFDYAKKIKRGLILVIDEAEPLLADRANFKIDSKNYKIIAKFLHHTSEPSNKVMLVFTTNYKIVFDDALEGRIAESIEMKLPGHNERKAILQLYRDKLLMDPKYNTADFIISVSECLNEEKLEEMASQLADFSGRNLRSVINDIKADASVSQARRVTSDLVNQVVKRALKKYTELKPKQANKQTPLLSPAAIELLNKEINKEIREHSLA